MTPQLVIGVDVGGTKCAAGLVSLPDGVVRARRLQPTRPKRGGKAVLADVIAQVSALREEAHRADGEATGLGIGVAELVSVGGEVLSNATIAWKDLAVAAEIEARTDLRVRIEADVRAAARAEGRFGAGRKLGSFLYVTVGTGISAALVINGAPYTGARGLTGTFASARGLIPSDSGELVAGPPLEQFAAGPALAVRLMAQRRGRAYSSVDVIELCAAGDGDARSIVTSAGRALGAAVAQLVNVFDPEAIVIGGGLGLVGGQYRESLDAGLRDHVWSELHRGIPLLSAALGPDAGLIGAALAVAAP
jgi:glucokinase